ncbi:MAG: ComF family protein [Bacteroidales bacterium]
MSYFYYLADDFFSLLFPRICHGCGNHLLRNEKLICTECYVMIPRTNYHMNPDNPVARLFWGRCRIEKAAAFSFYTRDSRIRKLIHHLKYGGIKEIGYELGRIYALSLQPSGFLNDIDVIIPVPLHRSKIRKRGFNQSDMIARGISDISGIPVGERLLVRSEATATQTRKSRFDRWTNVEGIFRVTDPGSLKGRHAVIVDDVITTGSTLEACADELLKTGDTKVSVLSLAFSVI